MGLINNKPMDKSESKCDEWINIILSEAMLPLEASCNVVATAEELTALPI